MIQLPDQETQRRLLAVARDTAQRLLSAPQPAASAGLNRTPGRFGGAFVTFWNQSRLRGCVGTLSATSDIESTIEDVTGSSLADPRFAAERITRDELPELEIEISLLSDPAPTLDPLSLCIGRHGIIVRVGDRSGCFLPRVAIERNWSAVEFLDECCVTKAGLPPGAWKRREATVLLFEACSFRESTLADK
jgi:AmmeMemoRadiSam system protein A